MKLIDGKSVLLGMGLGIIITSLLGAIFYAGYTPQLSDAEIISLARKIGMTDKFQNGDRITRQPDGSLLFKVHESETFTEISKRLYEAGLIESTIEFEIILKKDNLQDSIKPGEYIIRFDDDAKSIAAKLTGSGQ